MKTSETYTLMTLFFISMNVLFQRLQGRTKHITKLLKCVYETVVECNLIYKIIVCY